MEKEKKESLLKNFIKWLNSTDENEILDGDINEKAFKGEDARLLKELQEQAKKIDERGEEIFSDKKEKRTKNFKGLKANVVTPSNARSAVNREQGTEREQ